MSVELQAQHSLQKGISIAHNDGVDYPFDRLRPGLILNDMRFSRNSLKSGEKLPDFELMTPDGNPIRSSDFTGDPARAGFLIITGSLTCPMTIGSLDDLRKLHAEFGEFVPFVLLYVREGHPGENYPQPKTYEDKVEHARLMRESHHLPWPVAVDSIDGDLHRSLDAQPNSAHLIDRNGNIVFRALFAGDVRSLRVAIERLASGREITKGQTSAFLGPVIPAIGHIPEVIDTAGATAWRDLWIAAPPMAVMAKLSNVFDALPEKRRGLAVMASLALAGALTMGVLALL